MIVLSLAMVVMMAAATQSFKKPCHTILALERASFLIMMLVPNTSQATGDRAATCMSAPCSVALLTSPFGGDNNYCLLLNVGR
jgi:hypothetical protein